MPEWTTIVRCGTLVCLLLEFDRWKSYSNDALGADQLDELVSDGPLGIALTISFEVAQIAYVTFVIRRSTVGLVERVDYEFALALSRLDSSGGVRMPRE